MYTSVNDNGNIYIFDEEGNSVSFKEFEIASQIASDNSILTGDGAEDIIAWCNKFIGSKDDPISLEIPEYMHTELGLPEGDIRP